MAAAACLLLSGCGQQQPKVLNTAQAQALAIMRFDNYNKRLVELDITGSTESFDFHARAMVDTRQRVGWAEYTTTQLDGGATIDKGMLAWSDSLIETSAGGSLAKPAAPSAWTERTLTSDGPMDLALVLALNLSADRPENPALLQQSGARYLRSEDGGKIWVISGPGSAAADTGSNASQTAGQSKTTYWLRHTGEMVKFEGMLAGRPVVMKVLDKQGFPSAIPATIYQYLQVKD